MMELVRASNVSLGKPVALPVLARYRGATLARRGLHLCRSGDSVEGWDQPVFGIPMAPSEIWEGFQRSARDGFLAQALETGKHTDPVLAALYIAAEDDAVSTKSTVELPVASYTKRVDALVRVLQDAVSGGRANVRDPGPACAAVEEAFYGEMDYSVAWKPLEAYSPYRVYMHKVLAQRRGTPAALAVVLATLVLRGQAAELLPPFDFEVGLPEKAVRPGLRPVGGTSKSSTHYRWTTPREAVLECLETLKRTYWSWEWMVGSEESFRLPAESFLGAFGRANKGSRVVGVMQATGRPFGDLGLALLATERLSLAYGGLKGGRRGAVQVRDCGILLCHLGRHAEAHTALQQYSDWLSFKKAVEVELDEEMERPQPNLRSELFTGRMEVEAEARLVERLLLRLKQMELEHTFSAS